MKVKRLGIVTLALVALLLLIAAVSGAATRAGGPESGKLRVVCTTFPQYDWARQILGERADDVELTLLLDSGLDLHSFQPSVDDVVAISACDLFIYVGGESDEWVENALASASNPEMVVINLLEALGTGAKIEEIVEGMEEEEGAHAHGEEEDHAHEEEEAHAHEEEHAEGEAHEEEHEDEEAHAHEHEGEEVYDEHVWLSLRNARVFCAAITDALVSLDGGHADVYRRNLAAYDAKLAALDTTYRAALNAVPVKTLLFGDRFPFRYLVDDYGLAYHAAFPGCSAETEASFETIVFLADKADELGLKTVMTLEGSDRSIANTIIANTAAKDQRILQLDSMQSVTARSVEEGTTYLSVMESNLNVLKEALR